MRPAPDEEAASVDQIAAAGVNGATQPLPHLDAIQASFGSHDVSQVRAQVGGAAASSSEALGADAYATGDRVAFARPPDLHLAAHEAAHVVQQRQGVRLQSAVGAPGDHYEQNADAAADAVVSGRSAESILDGAESRGPGAGGAVQRQTSDRSEPDSESTHEEDRSEPIVIESLDDLLTLEKQLREATRRQVSYAGRERDEALLEEVKAQIDAWIANFDIELSMQIPHVFAVVQEILTEANTRYRQVHALSVYINNAGRDHSVPRVFKAFVHSSGTDVATMISYSNDFTMEISRHYVDGEYDLATDTEQGETESEGLGLIDYVLGAAALKSLFKLLVKTIVKRLAKAAAKSVTAAGAKAAAGGGDDAARAGGGAAGAKSTANVGKEVGASTSGKAAGKEAGAEAGAGTSGKGAEPEAGAETGSAASSGSSSTADDAAKAGAATGARAGQAGVVKQPYRGAPGEEIDPGSVDVFRGGSDFTMKPGEVKVKGGMVQPTHGPSLDTDPAYGAVASRGAKRIKSIPSQLRIIQRGQRATHFEVVPREPMKPETFQSLLDDIQFE